MGKNIDKTFIQSKMLNESKGPAVHSLRAQADKQEYSRQMRKTLENTEHLTIRSGRGYRSLWLRTVRIKGVKTFSQGPYITPERLYCVQELLPAGKMYLRDVSNPTGPKWTAGGYTSDGLPDRKWN